MPKRNLRYNSISNAAGNTAAEISKGVKTLTTPLVYTLDSMKNSLTTALESNSRSETKNPSFDGVVTKGGKRKSKKRKSRKHRKTAKK